MDPACLCSQSLIVPRHAARVAARRHAGAPAAAVVQRTPMRLHAVAAGSAPIAHSRTLRVRANAASGAAAADSTPTGPSSDASKEDSEEKMDEITEETMPVWMPGPNDAPPASWEKNPLREFSKIPVDLVVLGTLWALFMSELLRYVCEAPAPLPMKIIGGAMVAFCLNGGMLTGQQLMSARASEKGGQPAQQYRLWTYVKAFGYLSGLIVTVVKHTPALGMCLFFGSNIAFLTLNSQSLSRGAVPAVVNLAAPARKLFRTIALLDFALLALTVGAWQLTELGFAGPATALAGLVAAFAAYQSFQIHYKKKAM